MSHFSLNPPARQLLTLAGHQVEVAIIAPTQIPALVAEPRIVLLHEGLGSIDLWRDFPARLANRLAEPVLVYSRYGHGQSEPLNEARSIGFMHDEGQYALPDLLRQFSIEQAILIGHSDGASIALIHAASYPATTRAVVALAPHLFIEPICINAISQARRDFNSSGLAQRLARYHRDARRTFAGWSDVWLAPEFPVWNIEHEVAAIKCKVLAIQGEQDQYGTMRQIERIAELVSDTSMVKLQACKHSPHLEQTELVLTQIANFVASL